MPSGLVTTNTYRADGLRHQKQDSSGTTRFVYDGQSCLAETDTANATQVAYTQEPRTYGGVVGQRRKSGSLWTPSYYHFDAVGSSRGLTGSNQAFQVFYPQLAFGQPLVTTDTFVNAFRFIGQFGYYLDSDTGLFLVRQRVYDANLTRWVGQDPARSDHNLFRYAGNCPLHSADPSGLQQPDGLTVVPIDSWQISEWTNNQAARPLDEVLLQQLIAEGAVAKFEHEYRIEFSNTERQQMLRYYARTGEARFKRPDAGKSLLFGSPSNSKVSIGAARNGNHHRTIRSTAIRLFEPQGDSHGRRTRLFESQKGRGYLERPCGKIRFAPHCG